MGADGGDGYINRAVVVGDGGRAECITDLAGQASIDSYRYYASRRTVLEMLRDRGYEVDESELTRSFAQFRADFGDKPDLRFLRISVSLRSNPQKKVLVVFMGTNGINLAAVRGIYGQILEKGSLQGLILILQSKMNHFARKALVEFPFKVEIFHITDLLVNITKHVLEPKHEILTVRQKQLLLEKHKLQVKQLPRLRESDPIAKYHGLQKGQVFWWILVSLAITITRSMVVLIQLIIVLAVHVSANAYVP